MRILILATGETVTVGDSYGRRQIEQGQAVLAPPVKKPEPKAAKAKKE